MRRIRSPSVCPLIQLESVFSHPRACRCGRRTACARFVPAARIRDARSCGQGAVQTHAPAIKSNSQRQGRAGGLGRRAPAGWAGGRLSRPRAARRARRTAAPVVLGPAAGCGPRRVARSHDALPAASGVRFGGHTLSGLSPSGWIGGRPSGMMVKHAL